MEGSCTVSAKKNRPTLCWNCHNATGGCSWSRNLTPVKGWKAISKENDVYGVCYKVIACPEFIRDAVNCGMDRLAEEEQIRRIGKLEGEEPILGFFAS